MTRFATDALKRSAGTLLCLLTISVFALAGAERVDSESHYFNRLQSTNSGLSYNCVHAIVQDMRGFIWIGTSDGLNRYDGVNFRTFRKDEIGVNSSFVISLCEDDGGNLWVGTDSGVAIYDSRLDRFRPFDMLSDKQTVVHNKVTTIKKDRQGAIWLAVNNQGLFCYRPENNSLRNYFVENGRQTLPANISSFCFDMNNECYLALYFSNLYRTDSLLSEIVPVEFGAGRDFFGNDNIVEIIESANNTLYVASVDKGVCEIVPRRDRVNVLIPADATGFIPESMYFNRHRELWVATTQGAYVYDTGSGHSYRLMADKQDKFSLSDNHVLSVFTDSSDGIWIGTNAGGVNYSEAFHKNFDKYYMADNRSLADCLVRGFADDGHDRLWITTEKQGLLTLSLKDRQLDRYRNGQLPDALFGICYDDGMLWLGSFHGIYRLDTRTGQTKIYSRIDRASQLRDNKIYVIYKTSRGDLLVGTTLGMLRYDRTSDSFVSLPACDGMFITDIVEDSSGNLWVATYANGLIRYNPYADTILNNYTNDPLDERSLPSNKIMSVFYDSVGRIWATTFGAGFCLYDPRDDRFVNYNCNTLGPSLPSDINYKIVEDDDGHLWLSSNKGLVCFTPSTLDVKAYTTVDGVLNNEFNYNAGIKTAGGTLYFGSTDGFVRFNPGMFYADTRMPEIIITDLCIDDRIVRAGDDSSPLECNIDLTRKLELTARQNSFGFGFSLLGFASPASNTILCKLEGYDALWRRIAADNTVFYSNIPAGNYRLLVKGVNSNGIWNEGHPAIDITVARRFYKSTAAISIYLLLFVTACILCWRYFYRKALSREQRRQEEFKRASEIELFNEKMNFFSNIVHEIKTPLTLIRTPLQNIISSGACDDATRDDLQIINNNTEYLSQLVRELLDFVRIENHGYMLEHRRIDLIEKIGFLCFNFSETAKNNNVRLKFTHADEQLFIAADEQGLNKILNNLLHNAVKYAESWIDVSVRRDGDNVVVSIRNDGPVVPREVRNEIFKPFVQYDKQSSPYSKGVGIGLSLARTLAEMHSGSLIMGDSTEYTDFILTLPVGNVAEGVATVEEPPVTDDKSDVVQLLIVEDNTDLASYMKRKLQPDYRILTAPTAERALELLKQSHVDLLITDIALPGISGLELCKRVCDDFETSHIPVIILSALSSNSSKMTGMENGASLYIEKPFNMEYLQVCIKNILDKRIVFKNAFKGKIMPITPSVYDLPHSDEEFLQQLDSIIVANISDPTFSNDQLAEALYLSKSTLNRKIKGLLDATPNDYIRTKRLVVAAQMLTRSHCRINEVCYSVGFNTPSYFAKCFKKYYGMLPAEYMKEHNPDNL